MASATLGYTGTVGRASVTARYIGSQFEDDLESQRLDSAITLDASAELPLTRGVALTLAAENLLDEEIEAGIADNGLIDRGTPRTLWVGLRFSVE